MPTNTTKHVEQRSQADRAGRLRSALVGRSAGRRVGMRLIGLLGIVSALAVGAFAPHASAAPLTHTFEHTRSAQTWTVPAGVTEATFTLYGGAGGNDDARNAGGRGGSATATIAVAPGEKLQVNVGGQGHDGVGGWNADGGFNGGGSVAGGESNESAPDRCRNTNNAGGGGGASDVRRDTNSDAVFSLTERLVVAGGGGGASDVDGGGSGGGATGGDAALAYWIGGLGGTQTSGGSGGTGDGGVWQGQSGALGEGGDSDICTGGGGGGLYGGGAGGSDSPYQGGGGGGSGFTPDGGGMQNGVRSGHGQVVITYVVDTTAPETTIDSGPSGLTNDTTPSFSFRANEPSTFECSLDQGTPAFGPCGSPAGFGPLADGAYTFRVRATDRAGNVDPSPASQTFTVKSDTVAPTTSIGLDPTTPDGDDQWYTSPVRLTVSATDNAGGTGVADTRCVLDPATAPTTYADLPSGCAYTGSGADVTADGQHTLYVASIDRAGNVEGVTSTSFKLDRTAPTLAPTVSPDPLYLNQTGASASPNASDATSDVASASCGSIDTSTPGDHTVTCTATDKAGNTATETVHYLVEYRIVGFFEPAANSQWRVSQAVPIKIALADVAGTRISDAEADALASACRVTFSASGAQSVSSQCMRYDEDERQFVYNWRLAKSPGGAATITVTVSYPGTSSTTTKSESITIAG